MQSSGRYPCSVRYAPVTEPMIETMKKQHKITEFQNSNIDNLQTQTTNL